MKSIGLVPELLVTDTEKTVSFYVDILGFDVVYHRKEEKFAYIKKGNAEMMIEQIGVGRNWITGNLEKPYGRGINFQIETDSIDELYTAVQKNSVPIFMPIEEKWYKRPEFFVGNKQFIVQDPDGYPLRFYQDLGTKKVL
jgi:catechol 2,3-dioxygenase-like lactoylglutathione lyase family enzyme